MIDAAAVVGCGSIGRRHLRNLRCLGVRRVIAVDTDGQRLSAAAGDLGGLTTCSTVDEALAKGARAIIVAVPPYLHVGVARAAVAAGADVFVEKPLSHTCDDVDVLLEEIDAARCVAAVGYNLRFHAGLVRLKALLDEGAVGAALVVRAEFGQYLPDWRPSEDYRKGYNAHKSMGGGIILDASHELDYVTWITGPATSVFCTAGRLSRLEIDVEDAAAITISVGRRTVAEIHLDSIQRQYTRTCKIVGEDGTLIWDYLSGVTWLRPGRDVEHFALTPDSNDMYLAEMRHFLTCVRREDTPHVDARRGAEVLKLALAAQHSAETGLAVTLA